MRITEIIQRYKSPKGKLPVYVTDADGIILKDGRHISEVDSEDIIHVTIIQPSEHNHED